MSSKLQFMLGLSPPLKKKNIYTEKFNLNTFSILFLFDGCEGILDLVLLTQPLLDTRLAKIS